MYRLSEIIQCMNRTGLSESYSPIAVWLHQDGFKQTSAACNRARGWVGTKGKCKRVKKGEDIEGIARNSAKESIQSRTGKKKPVKSGLKPLTEVAPIAIKKIESVKKGPKGDHSDLPFFGNFEKTADGKVRKVFATDKQMAEIKEQQKKFFQERFGFTKSEAKDAAQGISDWSDDKSYEMRAVEKKGGTTPELTAMNKYLKASPKFEGPLFRGGGFADEKALGNFLKDFQTGGSTKAVGSFSSSPEVARGYAEMNRADSHPLRVVVKVEGNKSGATINAFASWQDTQDEVLVPKGTKYKITGMKKHIKNGVTFYGITAVEV